MVRKKRTAGDENQAPSSPPASKSKSSVAKVQRKTIAKPVKSGNSNGSGPSNPARIERRAMMYHKKKWEVLAPFVAKLMLEKRLDWLRQDCTHELTVFERRPSSYDNSRRNLTLGAATEEERTSRDEEDDGQSVVSRTSHEEEWRSVTPVNSDDDDSDQ